MITRRNLIASILATAAAPAIARSGVLMPVRPVWVPTMPDGDWLFVYEHGALVEVRCGTNDSECGGESWSVEPGGTLLLDTGFNPADMSPLLSAFTGGGAAQIVWRVRG